MPACAYDPPAGYGVEIDYSTKLCSPLILHFPARKPEHGLSDASSTYDKALRHQPPSFSSANGCHRWSRRIGNGPALHRPGLAATTGDATRAQTVPVILATDIGDDIDDTWALGFLLRCPELNLKLVLGEYGKSQYRAKLIAKFLQTVGRPDIPVGLGADTDPRGQGAQAGWIRNYDLNSYPGPLHRDGVQAAIDTINQSREPVTVICIAPMPNLAAALARDPQIARRARFVGMCGSLRVGYDGRKPVSAEWNVKADVTACQAVFAAP